MNLTQLNCFIAVAETLSFTKAAQKLNFVQSAVSSNISELEKSLGAELFARSNRSVRLTEIGEELLKNAYKISALVDDCYIKCGQFNKGITGNLTVGYVFAPTMKSVMEPIQRFVRERPEVSIQFRAYADNDLAQAAIENDADLLACCPNTVNRHLGVLSYKPLFREKYKVAMSREHPLAGESRIWVEQLRDENFCMMDRKVNTGLYSDVITMCNQASFTPTVIAECNAITALMLALEINHGLTILPTSWQDHIGRKDNLVFVELEGGSTERVVGYAWNKNNNNPSLAQFLRASKFLEP